MKILRTIAIDDDPTSLLLIEQIASKIPEINLAGVYRDAIEGAAAIILEKPDLLLLDIDMPDFNGLQIMRSLVNPPKIIVISGNPRFEDEALGLEAVTFISKPLQQDELESSIFQLMSFQTLGLNYYN